MCLHGHESGIYPFLTRGQEVTKDTGRGGGGIVIQMRDGGHSHQGDRITMERTCRGWSLHAETVESGDWLSIGYKG